MVTSSEPARAYPPVTPPSGKFIVQLFLVPGTIVVVATAILWGFSWLVGNSRTPARFLKDLSSSSLDVRWRAADDLAQVIKKDPVLASDPTFALDIADLLRQNVTELSSIGHPKAGEEGDSETGRLSEEAGSGVVGSNGGKKTQETRDFTQYLINCLGSFTVPVGVPLLSELALNPVGKNAVDIELQRRLAIWGLASIGERVKHLDQLSAERRRAVESALENEMPGDSERSQWAAATARYLKQAEQRHAEAMGVDRVLEQCARTRDPFTRNMVAFALNIWRGNGQENARMERTLWELSKDDGHGAAENQKVRGLEIRYKAVEGLARRGSSVTKKCLPTLSAMLDEALQRRNFTDKDSDRCDEAAVVSTVTGALRSITELHRQRRDIDLSVLKPFVKRLSQSAVPEIKADADAAIVAIWGQS